VAATVTAASLATAARAAGDNSVSEFVAQIKDKDDKVRGPAWQSAAKYGAPAVKPLAEVMTDPDMEVARAAKRALWKIVSYAGRPGAAKEARAVVAQLTPLLSGAASPVRREVLWMLSEIGDDASVEPIRAVLKTKRLLDDARCALQRIPGDASLAALKAALDSVPTGYKNNIAHALRVRGMESGLEKYPEENLIPTTPTATKPAGTK
jgi:HEAT repeat protein